MHAKIEMAYNCYITWCWEQTPDKSQVKAAGFIFSVDFILIESTAHVFREVTVSGV